LSTPDIPLGDDEVEQISRIIETLDRSTFDYLQLEFGELRLTIAKGGVPLPAASAAAPAATVAAIPAAAPATAPAAAPAASAAPVTSAVADGTVGITSPMIGRFYSQSEPGAAPYVTVGAKVGADSTVGLVEAMKMFNAVHAGVDGTITEICVTDAALVEYGQVLFRVRPA
jgi:acetyl-CoA carboxylase biotin carboxyl carrier protein